MKSSTMLLIREQSKIVIDMSQSEAKAIVIIIFVVLGILLIAALVGVHKNKTEDNDKPLWTEYGTILEKTSNVGIDWYIIELDNHQRLRLRNFNNTSLILSVGDYGKIEYRGNTICSFHRAEKR